MLRCRTLTLLSTAILLVACGSDSSTGPTPGGNGDLTAAERNQLTLLMTNPTVINALLANSPEAGMAAFAMPLMAGNFGRAGTITIGASSVGASLQGPPSGSYQAFGGQFDITVQGGVVGSDAMHVIWTGFIAVDNLSAPTALLSAGVIDLGAGSSPSSVPSTSIGGESASRLGFGSWLDLSSGTPVSYIGTTGSVGVSSTAFAASTSCPIPAGTQGVTGCSVSTGTMAGSFGFAATQFGGGANITVPTTGVSVPAVRVAISIALP